MCGITGIWNLDGAPVDPGQLRTFTDSLTHRGPDGVGTHLDGPLGLGHRRLSILDLSENGAQPMPDADRRYWITFNGEIYNFLELRDELQRDGVRFTTDSDTEVILNAYKRWGVDCVFRFNGMWAFAIWDSAKQELFLSRDRFGVKPLRYVANERLFAFASELKSFRHLPRFSARENVAEMRNLIARGGMSPEETLFEGVKRLPGGYNLLVSRAGIRKWRWWRTIDHLPEVPKTFAEQIDQFRELFYQAVRLRLRSDVPVASALSGGLDSSSIVCTLPELSRSHGAREAADCHHAFVGTFPGTLWDERPYAEAVIAKTEAQAHFVTVDMDMVMHGLDQYCYDIEMCGDRLSIPLWLTYRAMRREGIVVSLDGHGGDEMLAGYARPYQTTLEAEGNLLTSPLRTSEMARTLHGLFGSGVAGRRTIGATLASADPLLRKGGQFVNRGRDLFSRHVLRRRSAEWIPHGSAVWAPRVPPIQYLDEDTQAAVQRLGVFRGSLYKEFHGTTLVNVLRTFDRCSMAHGVEIRMPFLDWRLVTFAFALPESALFGGGFTKRILREAMRGALPDAVRTRRGKIGFSSPLPNWLNGPLGDWVMREVETPEFLRSELWNGPAIRDFVKAKHAAKNWTNAEGQNVWRFVQANRWRTTLGHA